MLQYVARSHTYIHIHMWQFYIHKQAVTFVFLKYFLFYLSFGNFLAAILFLLLPQYFWYSVVAGSATSVGCDCYVHFDEKCMKCFSRYTYMHICTNTTTKRATKKSSGGNRAINNYSKKCKNIALTTTKTMLCCGYILSARSPSRFLVQPLRS